MDMKIKNTEIRIVRGDITEQDVDAIVSAANNELTMGEGLAGAIKKKAGAAVEEEAMARAPVDVGNAIVTSGGHCKAKKIIHAVTVGVDREADQENIRHAARSALDCAKEVGARSLVFPALGCGVGGFPLVGAAKIITQEILKFCKGHPDTLDEITFCLYEEEIFNTFDEAVSGYIHHIQENLGPGPYVTVDIIIELSEGIILIERSNPPYGWALPGGFVDYGESLERAAIREAKEETNLDLVDVRQFHTYSQPDRDPRFHTISTVFIASGKGNPQFGDDAKGLKVVRYEDLLTLEYAFDHMEVIREYLLEREID